MITFTFPRSAWSFTFAIVLSSVLYSASSAQNGKGAPAEVARVRSVSGALLLQKKQKWIPLPEKSTVRSGSLLVSFPKTALVSKNGAAELLLVSDLGKRGVYPIFESAVVFNHNAKKEFDFEFRRGLLVFTNLKKKGSVKIRLHIRGKQLDLDLLKPGTKVVAELYSRHLPGLQALKKLALEEPIANLIVLVVKGRAFLQIGEIGVGLTAPPGPALVFWDNVHPQPRVQRLTKLPEAIKPASKDEKKKLALVNASVAEFMKKKTGPTLDKFTKSKEKVNRLVGVTMMGALDDLSRLLTVLESSKHADARAHSVMVLRNWLGREPGQFRPLYIELIKRRNYSLAEVRTMVQLLLGLDEKQRKHPLAYQILIDQLQNKKASIRELAHWQLARLVLEGDKITYDAHADKAVRDKAVQQWRKLIPRGKLPPNLRPKKVEKK